MSIDQGGTPTLLKIISNEKYDDRDFELLIQVKRKLGERVTMCALAPTEEFRTNEKIKIYNWEAIG